MSVVPPFNLTQWLAENRHLLKPPVANKNLSPHSEDYIVMVVAGPNARKDYHYNETEEIFYQLEGRISVKTQQDGRCVAYELGPGDLFICPAKTPHSPVRQEGSVGLVIERIRAGRGYNDGLFWFCEECNLPLHQVLFELHDIEKDFLPHFRDFYTNPDLLTCSHCGHRMEADPRFV